MEVMARYIGCLNTYETRGTANNSTTNYDIYFFVSDFKIVYNNYYYSLITMPGTREEKYLCHNLFGDEIIQNCPKIDATHFDNDLLLLLLKLKKRLHVLEGDIIIIKKQKFDISNSNETFLTGRIPNDRYCTRLR